MNQIIKLDPDMVSKYHLHDEGTTVEDVRFDAKYSIATANATTPSKKDILMTVYGNKYLAMFNNIVHIPSHKNPKYQMYPSYSMADEMYDISSGSGVLLAASHAMGVHKSDFECSGPRKNLANSDLYFIDRLMTEVYCRKKGYCKLFLENVYEQIKLFTGDPHPVIVTCPDVFGSWQKGKDTVLTDRLIQTLLAAGFKPAAKNSRFYYLTR